MSTQEVKLQAIADAIREKDGTTELIPANDFPERIRAISSVPDGLRTITLAADPPEGGTVSGGGVASDGMTVTVKAEAAEGYSSAGWQENGEDVSEEPEYTFPVQRNRELIAVFAGNPASRLPEGYTEVEYIHVTKDVGIATGIYPSLSTTKIIIDIKKDSETTYYDNIFTAGLSNNYNFSLRFTSASVMNYRFGTGNMVSENKSIGENRTKICLNLPEKFLSVGDDIYTVPNVAYSMTSELFLLKYYTRQYDRGIDGNLYSAKIYNADILQRDFVPCINPSGNAGLYDLVSGNFFSSYFSGTITSGSAV